MRTMEKKRENTKNKTKKERYVKQEYSHGQQLETDNKVTGSTLFVTVALFPQQRNQDFDGQ